MLKLPGLIDPHVHLRYLDSHKEDFTTSTNAALAGGFTMILDMPNNSQPITTFSRLRTKINHAFEDACCDLGFYFGSLGENLEEFEKVKDLVHGLKLYLNLTTGAFIIDEPVMKSIYKKWYEVTEGKKPILLHAEADVMESVKNVLKEIPQPTHIVHVSSEHELRQVMQLREEGFPITCGVTPHHLFLTVEDEARLGTYGLMKPRLKPKKDQDFLWANLEHIDIIESDHAPHTQEEKESVNPPFGVPGLETTLPLLLTAMNDGKMTKEDIIDKCNTKVREIFHISDQSNTYIEVDEHEQWTIKNENLYTKCKWSPFDGFAVKGKVKRVIIRGTKAFEDGKILVSPGFGKIY